MTLCRYVMVCSPSIALEPSDASDYIRDTRSNSNAKVASKSRRVVIILHPKDKPRLKILRINFVTWKTPRQFKGQVDQRCDRQRAVHILPFHVQMLEMIVNQLLFHSIHCNRSGCCDSADRAHRHNIEWLAEGVYREQNNRQLSTASVAVDHCWY